MEENRLHLESSGRTHSVQARRSSVSHSGRVQGASRLADGVPTMDDAASAARSGVAQRQSIRLLTEGLWVRIPPPELPRRADARHTAVLEAPTGRLVLFLAL